jgi:hypothetical protein
MIAFVTVTEMAGSHTVSPDTFTSLAHWLYVIQCGSGFGQ